MAVVEEWRADLDRWLVPFLAGLEHPSRRAMCPLYVAGLIGPGERKSTQPMAERLGLRSHDALHHFIAAGAWDAAPLEAALLAEADRLVGGPDAWLVVDDTALPKKGTHSVGVAPQYASALGKNANCQTLVSLTLAAGEVPVPITLRLFLPGTWTRDPVRLDRARVPDDWRTPRTKPELALVEIDRALAAGVRFRAVLADAGYGLSAPFRQGLSARDLVWAVGIPRTQKVYPTGVGLIFPWPAVDDPASGTSPTSCRRPPRRFSPPLPGARSAGAGAPRASSAPASRPCASASPMARRSASGMAGHSTCPAKPPGSWASTARPASGNTTSPTCRPTRT
jgi:SRSO17 transposase